MICGACHAGMAQGRLMRSGRVRGFTLIELMITVAIIAIIVAIAVPSYQDSVRKSRRGQVKADITELAQRAERFHSVNNSYVGFWASIPAAAARVAQPYAAIFAQMSTSLTGFMVFPVGVMPVESPLPQT